MFPRQFLYPRGAWYLEKYTDDVMRTFPRGSTFYWGKHRPLDAANGFQLCGSGLSFSLPQFSIYELRILLLSLKYFIEILESKVNFVKLYKKLKYTVTKIQQQILWVKLSLSSKLLRHLWQSLVKYTQPSRVLHLYLNHMYFINLYPSAQTLTEQRS